MTTQFGPAFGETERHCVHQLFEAHASREPDATAVAFGDRRVSYRELDQCANRLAMVLRDRRVGPEVLVGVYGARSPEIVVGVLAVLKAGGAYVPLDPDYPRDRIASILEDARLSLVIAHGQSSGDLDREGVSVLNPGAWMADEGAGADPRIPVDEDNTACVIYTSGSTGRPKGVVIPHRAITARIRDGYQSRRGDVQKASLAVVGHFSDLLMPLARGLCVHIVSDRTAKDAAALTAFLEHHDSTRVVFVPSLLRNVLDNATGALARLRKIDTVIVGGEPPTSALVHAFQQCLPWAALINGYGTSETTGFVTLGEVTGRAPIAAGSPCPGSDVYILDDELNRVPPGHAGEVCVAGEQLARGYLDRPALTAQRFIPNPFAADGRRLYRTGDIGRWTAEGTLQLLGRSDAEVKLSGHRVHVGEIESALETHPLVAKAVVTVRSIDGVQKAVAVIVPRAQGERASAAELREHLRAKVPLYMVPRAFRIVANVPVLPNGKVDRRRLADSVLADADDSWLRTESDPGEPRTPTERWLAAVWAEVLDVTFVSRSDAFLDLGGESLAAMTVVARINDATGVQLSLDELLDNPTVEALSESIDARRRGLDPEASRAHVHH